MHPEMEKFIVGLETDFDNGDILNRSLEVCQIECQQFSQLLVK